jgi:methylmalonyl-CoA mutase, C-terminal domain
MPGPIRVLIAKVGLDGHDVGARVVARGLVDQGMEVVYTGLRRTPEQIAIAALQEDVDVIGVSILSGAHLVLLPRLRHVLREHGLGDVILIAGGIIPDGDVAVLETAGVDAVFHPGTPVPEIAAEIRRRVRVKAAAGK